jgi:hypothetical protein
MVFTVQTQLLFKMRKTHTIDIDDYFDFTISDLLNKDGNRNA